MKHFYKLLFLGVIVFSGMWSVAQQNPKIDKQIFFTNPNGMEDALKNFKIAEKYYKKGRGTFDEALKYYLKVYNYNPDSKVLNYKIAACYLWTSDKKSSLKYFLQSDPEVAGDYYLGLGRAYQYNLEFEKAKESYQSYISTLKPWKQKDAKKLIDQLVEECDVGKEIVQDSVSVFITNLGPIINSYYDDYGAVLNSDESKMYYTSKRPTKEPNKRVSRFKFKERILSTDGNPIEKPAQWIEGEPKIDYYVNTSVAGFDKTRNRIYFYRGQIQNGRLYSATMIDSTWKKIKPLRGGINHIAYKETTISMDKDGNAYFVTNRRGGYGGKDIWKAKLKHENKWYKPVNLGPVINTPFDEEGVYVTPDGSTLYFSSKGRKGMGGFDVYKSTLQADSTWSEPVNLGYPINTTADELFYYPTADTMVAIYATIRSDSYGGLDIYKIKKDPRIPFKLLGTVKDIETGDVLPATVNVYDSETQKLISSATVDTVAGIYMMSFEDVGSYFIQADYEGYKTVSENIACPTEKYATVVQDFSLEALKHPFTLIGRVLDVDKETPLKAQLTFKLASNPDSIMGRAVSVDSTGKYSVTFDDKFNMIIQVDAEDYYSIDEPVSAENEPNDVISKDIRLKRSKIDYTLTGRVTEEETLKPVHAALSFYYPGKEDPFLIVVTDSVSGRYNAVMDNPGPYLIEIDASHYFYVSEVYQFPAEQIFASKDFILKKMEVGMKFVMHNILFNSGKATLKPESYVELDKLVDMMLKNSKMRIEVSGHTDNIGSASVNKRLSRERALTVRNYLISQGVESERVEYQGYGFEQPIAPNDTPEGRAQNRRVEIKILNNQ